LRLVVIPGRLSRQTAKFELLIIYTYLDGYCGIEGRIIEEVWKVLRLPDRNEVLSSFNRYYYYHNQR
ncbi:MAG: hypothetical protein NZ807_03180, partial [Dehalococcoidia bacterium]|nr:hypothetical protein [Dehalococcoidia bacterium]